MTKLISSTEILFRQVHPEFFKDGRLGSRAFKPSSGDNGFMSTDREKLTSAESAYIHYTKHLKKQSAGVFSLSVSEFNNVNITCVEDPLAAEGDVPANPAHSLANYNNHTPSAWKNVSKRLCALAEAQGCKFSP